MNILITKGCDIYALLLFQNGRHYCIVIRCGCVALPCSAYGRSCFCRGGSDSRSRCGVIYQIKVGVI